MKLVFKSILIIWSFILCVSLYASDRLKKHEKAAAELLDLNFFKNGRGMVISPNLIKTYDLLKKLKIGTSETGILSKRWGVNLVDNSIIGIYSIPYKKMKIGTLGCVACHSGKAAGKFIVGLGNKNIDVYQIGSDTNRVQKIWGRIPRRNNREFKEIHKRAMHFTKLLANNDISNLSQGLVPTSLIKSWFYEQTDTPMSKNFGRGQVKIPHLWGYGEKRKTGSFWDGFANGVLPGWAVAVELRGGQSVENIKTMMDKVHHAEDALADLLPPKYPFSIDYRTAKRGEHLFQKYCMNCHGEHVRDKNQLAIYKSPKLIPLRAIKTDTERLDFVTDEFLALIDRGPLKEIMQYIPGQKRGYIAPRLWGIWSRFPYLHNASVPTIYDLLSSSEVRPEFFDLKESGERHRFDQKTMGLTVNRKMTERQRKKIEKRLSKNDRSLYDTSRVGHGNHGHEFSFYKSLTDENKKELIEYLKTL